MDVTQQSPTDPLSRQPQLRIDGLVSQVCSLTAQDLAHLSRESVSVWLPDPQDGVTARETWSGVRLSDVLRLAKPLPSAQYVRVHAKDFVVPISLLEAENAVLVDSWNAQPLTKTYGAPWRLALIGGACFTEDRT